MKKIKLISLILAVITVLCSCSSGNTEVVSGNYTLATGTASKGTYYSLGTCISGIWDKYSESKTTIATTNGSFENIDMILKGNADFGFVQNDILYYALEGQEMYEENKQRGISVVANLYNESAQFVVNASSEIYTVNDLVGKTVAVGKYGTATEAAARKILEAYGITYDMITVKYQTFSEAADDLSSGRIHASFAVSSLPSANILEYAKTREIRLLPISLTQSNSFKRSCPFFSEGMIGSDVYGMANSVSTVCIDVLLICRNDMPTANVYSVVKSLFDNTDEIVAGHAKGDEINPVTASETLVGSFHIGAKNYYDNLGEEPESSESESKAESPSSSSESESTPPESSSEESSEESNNE